MKVYYLDHKTPFNVTDEDEYNYFSEGFLEQGETYCLKLPKKDCMPPCNECGTKTKSYQKLIKYKEKNVGTWNYQKFDKEYETVYYCPRCDMIQALAKYNKTDWKLEKWSNESREPSYPHDVCHTCKYFMFHNLQWCYVCGQPMSKHKLSWADFKKQYPDYRQGY